MNLVPFRLHFASQLSIRARPALVPLARFLGLVLLPTVVPVARSAESTPPTQAPAQVDDHSGHASFGSLVAQQMHLADLGWSDDQINAFLEGVRAGIKGHGFPPTDATRRLAEDIDRRSVAPVGGSVPSTAVAAPASAPDPVLERFMTSAKAGFSLQQSSSGLLFKIIQPGSGPRPRPQDTVVITLKATAPDGKTALPQLSGKNVRVKVTDLIPGLLEGVQMLTLGGHIVLVIPPSLSFANGDWPSGVDRNIPLLFEVALDDIIPNESGHP